MNFRSVVHGCSSLVFCAVLLAACSGGGGGGAPAPTPTPTPTPTSTNTAPVAVASAPNGTSADEGQSLLLDASGSSDADGNGLTYSWSQTAGPAAVILNGQTDMATVTLPEVSADTVLTFEVAVSDGTATSTSSINLTALNITLSPTVNVFGTRVTGVQGLDNPRAVSLYPADPWTNGYVRLAGVEDKGTGLSFFYYAKGVGETLGTNAPAPLQGSAGEEITRTGSGWYGAEVMALRSRDEVLYYLHNAAPASYELASSASITDPCQVQEIQYFGQEAVAVGTGDGIDVALFYFNGLDVQYDGALEVTSSGSYCKMAVVGGGSKIYAVNADTNILHVWLVNDVNATATEYASTDLSLSAGDQVMAVRAFNLTRAGTTYIAVLASDASHDGDHRILIYEETSGVTQFVTSFSWGKGIPMGAFVDFDSITQQGQLIIALEDMPYAAVVGIQDGPTPVFGFDGYAPLRLGATEIASAYGFFGGASGYVVTYADTGDIDILRSAN